MVELAIRPMATSDLADLDALLRAAFAVAPSFVPRLERYRAIEPEGRFVGREGSELVGTVGAVRYGRFAYVGLMAVAPARAGGGHGRRLLESVHAWLDASGVECQILDATEEGAHLYERLRYVDAGATEEWHGPSDARLEGEAGVPVITATAAELAEVIRLDAGAFGAERARVWQRLHAELPDRLLLVPGRGFLLAQPGLLGPFAARDPDAARALLAAALRLPQVAPPRVQAPTDNRAARALLAAAGFEVRRTFRHMRRGDLAAAPAWPDVYGKGSYCLG